MPRTEYSFTGFFWPVGINHPYLARRGEPCEIVGYDLDLGRDAPLTFRARFRDGLELYTLPEEVDDTYSTSDSQR